MRSRAFLVGAALGFGLFAPFQSWSQPVMGHGHDDFWINTGDYRSSSGLHCCGPSDCKGPDDGLRLDSILDLGEAGYLVSITLDGQSWTDIPVPRASTHNSEDGAGWICGRATPTRFYIRCLFLPTLG